MIKHVFFGDVCEKDNGVKQPHISLGLQVLNRKKLYVFVRLFVSSSAMLSSKSLLTGSVEVDPRVLETSKLLDISDLSPIPNFLQR